MFYLILTLLVLILMETFILWRFYIAIKSQDAQTLYFRDLWIEKQAGLEQMLRDGAIDMNKVEPVGYWESGKFIRTDGGIYAEKK